MCEPDTWKQLSKREESVPSFVLLTQEVYIQQHGEWKEMQHFTVPAIPDASMITGSDILVLDKLSSDRKGKMSMRKRSLITSQKSCVN